ncbi:hypothetical protein MHU86_10486 [Fragilaria crotonensis]|nr:hypothetical protein MHU86_10486 [Fragilaria crotonensis]
MLPTTEQKEQTTMEESAQVDLQQHNKECCGNESSNSINESFRNNDDQDDESFVIPEVENVEPITPCSRESDELQKALLEAVVAHTQNEAELRALIAACEENARLKQLELEAIAAEKAEAEKRLAATEQEHDHVTSELSHMISPCMNGVSGTSTIESTQLSGTVQALEALSECLQTVAKSIPEEPLSAVVKHNQEIETLESRNAELRALCDRLYEEQAALRRDFEKKLAATEEKLKIVATLASSHLTGRMGLENRLHACEKERTNLAMVNTLGKAHDEVLSLRRNVELKSLTAEIERLRRMVRDARASQRIAEDEVARLAALESCSEGMSCVSSVYSESMTSAMGGDRDDISGAQQNKIQ